MTRAERAAAREQRLKNELADTRRQRAVLQAHDRASARVKQAKRRQRVGTLADDAGLLTWEDTTLAALFQTLALLHDTPDPVKVLDSLLMNGGNAPEHTQGRSLSHDDAV